nr:hypothetical protein [Tanacetum cinerariifolium]
NRVFNLENTKTAQAQENDNLKRRVKKLEIRKKSKTCGLRRLYKAGLSARVESSGEEQILEFLKKRRKFFAAKRSEERRNRPPTKAQQRSLMWTYLKNMDGWKPKALKSKSFAEIQELFDKAMKKDKYFYDGQEAAELKKCLEIIPDDEDDVTIDVTPLSSIEDLEVLWSIVKARFEKVHPVDDMDSFLLHTLKTMFGHHVEDSVWKNQQGLAKVKNWKLFYSCGVHYVLMQNTVYIIFWLRRCIHSQITLTQMWNDVRLQVDYEVEMAYDLLRLVRRQLREGYVPE